MKEEAPKFEQGSETQFTEAIRANPEAQEKVAKLEEQFNRLNSELDSGIMELEQEKERTDDKERIKSLESAIDELRNKKRIARVLYSVTLFIGFLIATTNSPHAFPTFLAGFATIGALVTSSIWVPKVVSGFLPDSRVSLLEKEIESLEQGAGNMKTMEEAEAILDKTRGIMSKVLVAGGAEYKSRVNEEGEISGSPELMVTPEQKEIARKEMEKELDKN